MKERFKPILLILALPVILGIFAIIDDNSGDPALGLIPFQILAFFFWLIIVLGYVFKKRTQAQKQSATLRISRAVLIGILIFIPILVLVAFTTGYF